MMKPQKRRPGRPSLGSAARIRATFTLSRLAIERLRTLAKHSLGNQSRALEAAIHQAAIHAAGPMPLALNRLPVPPAKLAELCLRFHVKRLAYFGSVLTAGFNPQSDVDVLVEFKNGHTPGLGFFGMQEELQALLGRTVDLNTPEFLDPRFRSRVVAEAQTVYAA